MLKNRGKKPIIYNLTGVALFAWANYTLRDVFYQILDGTKGSFTSKNTIRFIECKSYSISKRKQMKGIPL